LQTLRQQIASQRLTFQVGYTTAADFRIEQITGGRVPADLPQQIHAANAASLEFVRRLRAMPLAVPACSAAAPKWDWRQANGATAVKDQGACGSCWDFATIGAFEGSWRIRNNQIINASEQDILDCNPWGYSCAGGWWAFPELINPGVATEASYPYTHVKGACRSVARPYHAAAWGYVGTDHNIPSVAALKQALCMHGPLSVAVNATSAFQHYTGGVFNEHNVSTVNHGVTLIGWDDSKQAWLIKNSWGTGWGSNCDYGSPTDRGYMWIAYTSNNIGYAAAWVHAAQVALDLTARWNCNDGGTYFMRQVGNVLWWLGQSRDGGASWTNVFHGLISGNTISGRWADVPHGRIMNHGEMTLQIQAPNHLVATHRTGGFGGSDWRR